MPKIYPDVVQSVARENYIVHAYCEDGRIREIDMKPLIERGGVFSPLKDPDFSETESPASTTPLPGILREITMQKNALIWLPSSLQNVHA